MSNNPKQTKNTDQERKSPNQLYRRAILAALEDLKDHHLRSNIDLIRGRTRTILEDTGHSWNELIFLQSLKSIAQAGDITLATHVWAELSPSYKRRRADSLSKKMEQDNDPGPPLPVLTKTLSSRESPDSPKPIVVRRPEHEKWKIMPKKLYDKAHRSHLDHDEMQ